MAQLPQGLPVLLEWARQRRRSMESGMPWFTAGYRRRSAVGQLGNLVEQPVAARVRVADDRIAAQGDAPAQDAYLVLQLVGEGSRDAELEARVDDAPVGRVEERQQAVGEAAVTARVVAPARALAGIADEDQASVTVVTQLAAAEAAGGARVAGTPGR